MMKKEKPTHGGTRTGSGRKEIAAKKKTATIRLYDWQRKEIESKYGSLQRGVDSLCGPAT